MRFNYIPDLIYKQFLAIIFESLLTCLTKKKILFYSFLFIIFLMVFMKCQF